MHATDFPTGIYDRPSASTILGFGGSPRKNGNADVPLDRILKGARGKNLSAAKVHLRDFRFRGCLGCERCRKNRIYTGLNDGMSLLYSKISAARGLVQVSPTHNYNATAWMKAFINRL